MTKAEAETKLHDLMHGEGTKWWYAFAMASSETYEPGYTKGSREDILADIREKDANLRAIIKEHS